MSATFNTTIEVEDITVSVEVEYSYTKGCRGARDSLCGVRGAGPPLEPDEPPEVEILKVTAEDGQEILEKLDSSEIEGLEEKAFEDQAGRYADAMEQRAEAQAEDKRIFE